MLPGLESPPCCHVSLGWARCSQYEKQRSVRSVYSGYPGHCRHPPVSHEADAASEAARAGTYKADYGTSTARSGPGLPPSHSGSCVDDRCRRASSAMTPISCCRRPLRRWPVAGCVLQSDPPGWSLGRRRPRDDKGGGGMARYRCVPTRLHTMEV